MFGRLNRSIGGKITEKMGFFFLFSEQRSNYDFNKIYERNYMIKSCLKYSDVYFFYVLNKNIINHLINKYDEKKLTMSDIRKISRELSIFLNYVKSKTNTSDERILNIIAMKLGSNKTLFNILRYLYSKLYQELMNGRITDTDYVGKVKSLATTYVNKNIKLAITSLYGPQLVKDEEKIANEIAKNKMSLNEAKSIFLFKKKILP